jgi:hypothetical protein
MPTPKQQAPPKLSAQNGKAWFLAAVCLFMAFWSFGLLYEGFIQDHYSGIFTYPFVDEPAAWRAWRRLPDTAPIAEREIAARRLIQADPADSDSWLAVSYVEYLKAGGVMSPQALVDLDHSYAVGFFDRNGGVWRMGFALDNWQALTPKLREAVLTEAKVALKDPVMGPKLRARMQQVRNPAGRLAVLMMLSA